MIAVSYADVVAEFDQLASSLDDGVGLALNELVSRRESVLYDALVRHGVTAPIDPRELKHQLFVVRAPRGSDRPTQYFLHDMLIAEFWPIQSRMDGRAMRYTQQYKVY